MAVTLGNAINQSSPVNWAHPLSRGLTDWWMVMPGTSSGSRITDLTNPGSSRRQGVLKNGTKFVGASRPGAWGALDLDGVNDYVDVGDPVIGNTNATIVVHFRWNPSSDNEFLFDNSAGSNGGIQLLIRGASGEVLRGRIDDSGSNFGTFDSTKAVGDGLWHQVAMIVNKSGNASLNIDGVADGATLDISAFGDISGTSNLLIGAGIASPTDGEFDGLIDDIPVYNRALSSREILQLFQLSQQGYPGLLNRIPRRFVAAAAPAARRIFVVT